jgi:3-hydroxybutyryl-CoA dehydratase
MAGASSAAAAIRDRPPSLKLDRALSIAQPAPIGAGFLFVEISLGGDQRATLLYFYTIYVIVCCAREKLLLRSITFRKPAQEMDDSMFDNLPRGTIVIEDLEVGMTRYLQKQVTDHDIELFAQVSTDRNPMHLDDDYAQDTIFEGRIAHGMLTAGLISAVIGEQLPGHGTVYVGQTLKFMAPVRPGDMVRAEVTVDTIDHAKRRVTLATRCLVGDTVVLKGEAVVLAPSRKFD